MVLKPFPERESLIFEIKREDSNFREKMRTLDQGKCFCKTHGNLFSNDYHTYTSAGSVFLPRRSCTLPLIIEKPLLLYMTASLLLKDQFSYLKLKLSIYWMLFWAVSL